jgi:acetyl-CoA carboxylase carboxyl transferase subunit alpha
MHHYLEFEKSIAELEGKIAELRHLTGGTEVNIAEEVGKLQGKVEKLLRTTYAKLSAWQKAQVARHPDRPHTLDYVKALIEDFTPLAGDRLYGEDAAIVGGLGRFRGRSVMVLGIEKGSDTDARVKHNFGMAKPEGYRKAQRLMHMADHFHLPVVSFVDTSGAFPGAEAEARGQAEAIAKSIEVSFQIRVPFVTVIIGEGGSGGAIALACANAILMLEHSIYSVISPEGCASILWRDGAMNKEAADALRLTAQDLFKLGVVDQVIDEPLGGAHREPEVAMKSVGDAIAKQLDKLDAVEPGKLKTKRREKFLDMGKVGLG